MQLSNSMSAMSLTFDRYKRDILTDLQIKLAYIFRSRKKRQLKKQQEKNKGSKMNGKKSTNKLSLNRRISGELKNKQNELTTQKKSVPQPVPSPKGKNNAVQKQNAARSNVSPPSLVKSVQKSGSSVATQRQQVQPNTEVKEEQSEEDNDESENSNKDGEAMSCVNMDT